MALFKISKGSKANLPTTLTEGYCWYTYDDSKFYIDYKDGNGTLVRKALNAQEAEKLTGYDIATILNSSDVEIPTSKAVLSALSNKVDKVSGKGLSTNDYTTAEKNKLAGIAEGANAYTLPSAGTSLGGVKSGGDVTISDGVITVNDDSHNHTIANVDGLQTALDGKANKSEGIFFIEGTGTTDSTAKTSTWTGTSDRITAYYDGLTIKYKIGVAGQSTVTLNINNLGAKTVYRFGTSKLTTHFPVGSIITLTYHADLNNGSWITNDYDANTNTYQRVYESSGNAEYPITTRYNTTDGASYYAEYGRYTNGVTLNPSTNTITATTFKGALTGNADTATKATQDGNGNVIATTYAARSEMDGLAATVAGISTTYDSTTNTVTFN